MPSNYFGWPSLKALRTFVVAGWCGVPFAAFGEVPECPRAMEAEAHYAVEKLRTWEALYVAYRKYRTCDDGAIAEGFADAVGTLLAERWGSFARGAKLMERDPSFRTFVLRRHLGEITPQIQWVEIVENASRHCPRQYKTICDEILKANDG